MDDLVVRHVRPVCDFIDVRERVLAQIRPDGLELLVLVLDALPADIAPHAVEELPASAAVGNGHGHPSTVMIRGPSTKSCHATAARHGRDSPPPLRPPHTSPPGRSHRPHRRQAAGIASLRAATASLHARDHGRVHRLRAGFVQHLRARRERRAGRHHVVDEQHAPSPNGARISGDKLARELAQAAGLVFRGLGSGAARCAEAHERTRTRQSLRAGEGGRHEQDVIVPPHAEAVWRGRHGHHDIGGRVRAAGGGERRGEEGGDLDDVIVLVRANEGADEVIVDEGARDNHWAPVCAHAHRLRADGHEREILLAKGAELLHRVPLAGPPARQLRRNGTAADGTGLVVRGKDPVERLLHEALREERRRVRAGHVARLPPDGAITAARRAWRA